MKQDIQKLLPSAPDAKRGVICAMLLAPDVCVPNVRTLELDTFHVAANRILFGVGEPSTASNPFWSFTNLPLAKLCGIRPAYFLLHLKESEWRFNHRHDNL